MRLALFDIDGTLLHTRGSGRRALDRALQEVFGLENAMRGIRPDGKTDSQIVREALAKAAIEMPGGEGLGRFFSSYRSHFGREIAHAPGLQVFWGAYHLARRLSEEGRYRVGLATGNIRHCARLKLRRAGIESLFPYGGFGCDAEDRTELIRTAIRRGARENGGRAERVVVIGDTPNDVACGRRAGARTIAVATGHYSVKELRESGADLAVDSLAPSEELLDLMD